MINGKKILVVLPAYNAEETLEQTYREIPLDIVDEVLLVDDHSEDNSVKSVGERIHALVNFSLLTLEEDHHGKKDALKLGINRAGGSIILTSDADCRMGPGWIREMARHFILPDVHMVLGTVILEPANGLFRKMQSLEFFSLMATTAGAAGTGRPILSNAANLAFRREDYAGYLEEAERRSPSGDDMFLMLWIKKNWPASVRFTLSHDAIVRTSPMDSPGDFIRQRMRWTSKNRFYRDRDVILTSMLVYMANACLLLTLVAGIFQPAALWLFVTLFLVKSITDLVILSLVLQYYRRRKLLWLFLPLETIYFVYVSVTGLAGQFLPYSWKGRKVRTCRNPSKQAEV